jgi:hypothetical protein
MNKQVLAAIEIEALALSTARRASAVWHDREEIPSFAAAYHSSADGTRRANSAACMLHCRRTVAI